MTDSRLEAIFGQLGSAVLLIDPHGTVLTAAPPAARLLGAPDGCAGRPLTDYLDVELPSPAALETGKAISAPAAVRSGDPRSGTVLFSPVPADGEPDTWLVSLELPGGSKPEMETLLRRREVRFRALIQHASEIISILERDGTVCFQSAALERILGFTTQELAGTSFQVLVHPEDEPRFREMLVRALSLPDQPVRAEYRARTRSGEWRRLESIARNLLENPDIAGIVVNSRDVTEQRKAEADRLRSEQRFRALVERGSEVVSILDEEGRIRYQSPPIRHVLGYEPTELLGRSVFEQVHPRDLPRVTEAFQRLLARPGGLERVELQFRHGDGTWRVLEAIGANLLQDEAVEGIVVNTRDVTERHRVEAALRRSELDYRGLFEASHDGLLILDPDTEAVLEANERACRMYGFSRDELVGRSILDLSTNIPYGREQVEATLAGPGVFHHFETVHRRRDGARMHLEIHATAVHYAGRTAILSANRDVTEQKLLEQQLRQAQKMQAIGRLAGGVAHDFNNMLAVINGYAELLLADWPPGDRRRGYLTEISAAADRAAGLTRQLLTFSRKQIAQFQQLDLNELVLEVSRMLRRLIGEDIDLVTRLAPAAAWITADPAQMQQVLMNLALNARDAMPRGGRLSIETERVRLRAREAARMGDLTPGEYVLLRVTDVGCGMDSDTLAQIFEPFFTTKPLGEGVGLGLATTYAIVEQCRGHIAVWSEPGAGTTFEIYLPAAATAPPAERPAAPAAGPLPGGRETILLAEDEEMVRRLVGDVLRGAGYSVLEAESGTAALSLAAAHDGEIHLLLTDVVMPGMSGRELADRLGELRPSTRVLYMTGHTDDAVLRHGVERSGALLIQKPCSPLELAVRVREVLDTRDS
ncbi:MAG: PAS domain S-box protein [Armatimonadota bacterium]